MNQAVAWENVHSKIEWSTVTSYEFKSFMADYYWGKSGYTFLDLGCGTGANSLLLAEKGFNVIAVDQSKTACNKLSSDKGYQSLIKVINSDVMNLKLEESVDCVIMGNLIDCLGLEQSIKLLKLAKKWLRSDGHLFVKTLAGEIPDEFKRDGVVLYYYSIDELRKIFADCIGSIRKATSYTPTRQLPVTDWILDLRMGI